jgi:hypothetical protein
VTLPRHLQSASLAVFFLALSPCSSISIVRNPPIPDPPAPTVPPTFAPAPRTIYDGYATLAAILRAHARAESDEMDWAIGDQGRSHGRMQLNETYHAERAAKWGEYDPHKATDAIRIADRIWQENYEALGHVPYYGPPETWQRQREDLTIAAYRQGLAGVLANGATRWYIERVRRRM